jgi:DNA-directed RNA polymerase I, II, and III subunit RPABC2
MSDDEKSYYDSPESENSDEEINIPKSGLTKVKNIKNKNIIYNNDDSEPEDEQEDNEIENNEIEDIEPEDNEIEDDEEEELDDDEPDVDDDELDYDENNDSDIEIDEEKEDNVKPLKPKKTNQFIIEDDEEEDEYEENYLQKFDNELNKNYISEFHPECLFHNNDEVSKLSKVIKDENNIIIDPLHKTLPYLTKYEKARILGQRAKQIETGSKPFIKVPENIIDSYIIAELELREKKLPFIIKRPIPGGAFEYWNLKDLEIISF